ncbi:putative manganese efflux pump MntP [Maritalea myrionectae]|uniref:Putative manganese efflux pump MntP n=2 Tax=Maritalea myrionectae TaxID=454601 RepID=A0A2R4MIY4_9HYPH|nr:putative manganese efflux pump MntP [Maritalea myrionectae]
MLSNSLIAFSMSADAFAASLSKGAAIGRPRLVEALRIGLIFGVVEMITPIIGWSLGNLAHAMITSIDHWVAFGLLGLIGAKMIYEALHEKPAPQPDYHRVGVLLLTAIGTSIDAMAVGATLAFLEVNIVYMALLIGGATFVMATIGTMTGQIVGAKAGRIAEIIGGLILILIGTHILIDHLGVI